MIFHYSREFFWGIRALKPLARDMVPTSETDTPNNGQVFLRNQLHRTTQNQLFLSSTDSKFRSSECSRGQVKPGHSWGNPIQSVQRQGNIAKCLCNNSYIFKYPLPTGHKHSATASNRVPENARTRSLIRESQQRTF